MTKTNSFKTKKGIKKADTNTDKKFFIASIFILASSLLLLAISLNIRHNTKRDYQYSSITTKPFAVGQNISMGVTSIKIDSVRLTSGHGHFKAPKNQRYAIVTLHIKNRSEKPINISPASDTYIKNSSGKVSYLTPYELANPFRAGELPPGESIAGELSFLVNNQGENKIYIDSTWSGGVLSFALNQK